MIKIWFRVNKSPLSNKKVSIIKMPNTRREEEKYFSLPMEWSFKIKISNQKLKSTQV